MKEKIKESLRSIIIDLYGSSESIHDEFEISIQDNKEKEYGDLASNIALVLAKPLKRNPQQIAEEIKGKFITCLLYTSPSPRDLSTSRMPSSA